ncbi:aspartyl protease family protein [Novosphingobium resinovorum]|uniref:aspartyl protease family protein n=1 Tax=Novosphingobium resinovorum TaxID=158500 RepID=UPI002ED5DCC5|nr:aspartyl protease family protein [Novosphingobium resinovorum]
MSGLSMALAMLIANPVILGATPAPLSQGTETAVPKDGAPALQGDADMHSRMTIDVAVQGIGPYRFLIDTGSQRTVVSTALAGSLGLAPGPQVRVVGIAGAHDVATAEVDTIAIGPRAFHDLTVPLLERAHIGADGILGTDSFQHQRVLLDFTRNTIAIGDPAETGGTRGFEIVVRARHRSGRLILTDALIDGIKTDVVIDTGASGTVGNRALQQALAEQRGARRNRPASPLPAPLRGALSSVTGHELPVDLEVADRLELGRMGIGNVIIAYADAPAFAELKLQHRPAIFLGMRELRAFKRVAIDFSSRKVLFDLAQ